MLDLLMKLSRQRTITEVLIREQDKHRSKINTEKLQRNLELFVCPKFKKEGDHMGIFLIQEVIPP